MKRRAGFTLIELITVMGIMVAVMAAVSLALSAASESSRTNDEFLRDNESISLAVRLITEDVETWEEFHTYYGVSDGILTRSGTGTGIALTAVSLWQDDPALWNNGGLVRIALTGPYGRVTLETAVMAGYRP